MPEIMVVWTTFPDQASARDAARTLVEEHLVACAQSSSPVRSVYAWEGRIEEEEEVRVVFKTTPDCWPRLRHRLSQLHPYDVPQVVAVNAETTDSYADWLRGHCSSDRP